MDEVDASNHSGGQREDEPTKGSWILKQVSHGLPIVVKLSERWSRFEEKGVAAGVLALGLLFTVLSPVFLTPGNLFTVSRQLSYLGIMAVGMTFVFVSGEIDLSVGSMYGLTMIVMATVIKRGVDPWLVLPMGLAFGAVLGLVNGVLSRWLRIESIIITLGTLGAYRGLALGITNGWPIVGLPREHSFFVLGNGKLGGVVPIPALIWLLVSLIGGLFLAKTVYGRHVYAVGSSELSARVSGIDLNRIKVQALVISGACAALASALGMGFLNSAEPLAGTGFEINVIAAVIIGGAKLGGGSGSMLGSILGIALVGILRNGLLLVGVSAYWIQVASGSLIIFAVAVDKLIYRHARES